MNDRLAVILVSADRKVLEMGLEYTKNALTREWMSDIRLYFFGPSEVTIATDPDLQAVVRAIIALGTIPQACSWCSNKYGVSQMLRDLGCNVVGIGQPVSESIQDGFVPMTW